MNTKVKEDCGLAMWFIFCKDDLLLEKGEGDENSFHVPVGDVPPVQLKEWNTVHRLPPMQDGMLCKAVSIDSPVVENEHYKMAGLRSTFNLLSYDVYQKAGKAAEILYWDRNTRFCGVCGSPMQLHTDISKRCTNCGKEVWPLLATAIIVLVKRPDDKILLVHAHNLKGNYYGLVAGFVETGETLEECVQREVMEETGITVANIRYFASQPWPYPCGLMVGFFADYVEGDLHLQSSELAYGGWFGRDDLPAIPAKLSMARMLIDEWYEGRWPK